MKVKILAETQLDIDETKVLYKVLGELSSKELRQKGLSEDEIALTDSMFSEIGAALEPED